MGEVSEVIIGKTLGAALEMHMGRTKILRNLSSGDVLHFKYRYDVILKIPVFCTRKACKV